MAPIFRLGQERAAALLLYRLESISVVLDSAVGASGSQLSGIRRSDLRTVG